MAPDQPGRFIAILLSLAGAAGDAHAYIDPNAGGFLFQLLTPLLAVVTGMWLFFAGQVKNWTRRLLRLVFRGRKDSSPSRDAGER